MGHSFLMAEKRMPQWCDIPIIPNYKWSSNEQCAILLRQRGMGPRMSPDESNCHKIRNIENKINASIFT